MRWGSEYFVWYGLAAALLNPVAYAEPGRQDRRPDRILVQPRDGGRAVERVGRMVEARQDRSRRVYEELGGLRVVELKPGGRVEEALDHYRRDPAVLYAEPDFIRELSSVFPDDPRFVNGQSWALHNVGQSGGREDADIDAPEAWALGINASNVVVAVLDSGIRYTHQDLAGNLWRHPVGNLHGWNSILETTNVLDDEGHGTLISGIIGGVGNNGIGMAGVTWSVQLMAGKCFNNLRQGSDSDIIECIEFARSNGVHIVNASWGSYAFSHSLSNAIYVAGQAGVIFVCAAGNDARNIDEQAYYPAAFGLANIISVGASTRSDEVAKLSNYGPTNVHLFAPGDQLYSTFFASDNSYLGPLGGTSLAAPYVSGTLALARARFPAESAPQLISRVLKGVDPVAEFQGKCWTGGRLNAFRTLSPAMKLALSIPGPGLIQISADVGVTGRVAVLEGSADLTHWMPVYTNDGVSGSTWVFSTGTAQALPFYRLSSLP